jgi:hypothetical protein
MRKIALIIGLFAALLFVPLSKPSAGCVNTFISCPENTITCVSNGVTGKKCCDSVNECPTGTRPQGVDQTYNICDGIPDGTKRNACRACMGGSDDGSGGPGSTWTAIGCIKTDPSDLLGTIIGLGMGVAGGIAFLLILFGGLQIMTSAGNPEQLNAGRELVSSAITGLLLIIFSIFLLQFIGVNVIGIPGFTPGATGMGAK